MIARGADGTTTCAALTQKAGWRAYGVILDRLGHHAASQFALSISKWLADTAPPKRPMSN